MAQEVGEALADLSGSGFRASITIVLAGSGGGFFVLVGVGHDGGRGMNGFVLSSSEVKSGNVKGAGDESVDTQRVC